MRKISKKQSNLIPKGTRKRKQMKSRVTRGKEIIKISRNKVTETKNTIEKINETKSSFSEKTNKIDKPLARLIKGKKKIGPKSVKS